MFLNITKYSRILSHSFSLSKFFNLLYLYLDLVTFYSFCYLKTLLDFLVPGDFNFQLACCCILIFIEKKISLIISLIDLLNIVKRTHTSVNLKQIKKIIKFFCDNFVVLLESLVSNYNHWPHGKQRTFSSKHVSKPIGDK